jgi:hypothetical protein
MKPDKKEVFSQPSWIIQNDEVELAVTELGGHMAPVLFYKNANPVDPYYVSPWHNERIPIDTPVLVPLRGDFFCMPFGENNSYRDETHELHGETASSRWSYRSYTRDKGITRFELSMDTKVRKGTVTKVLQLVEGHNAVYCRHILEGYEGKMCLGHHATLDPHGDADTMRISTSPMRFGITNPHFTGQENNREYYSLMSNKVFKDLDKVPTVWKEYPYDDLTSFPRRHGFVDIVQIFAKKKKKPAWTCAVFPKEGFLWYSIKDPKVLPSTVIWMENYGRHQPPWNGRNCCIGLEDVCGYIALGLRESARKNRVSLRGIPTVLTLNQNRPTEINYIQGAAKIPKGFDRVRKIKFENGEATFHSDSNKTVTVPVRHDFVYTGSLTE